jgi:uncharacterized protein
MQPTSQRERHHILDVLRGFALCGVMIANMYTHSGYFFLSDADQAALPMAEFAKPVMWIIHFFTDGKFYSIFSLLFGIGFGLQITRAMQRQANFKGLFLRRLLILFFIGLAHALLFYVGDILTVYALTGLILLLFRNVSDKNLIRWAIVLLALPVIQYFFMWLPYQSTGPLESSRPEMFDMLLAGYSKGNLGDILFNNLGGLIFGRYPELFFTGRFFRVLAMFVLGYYVARQGYFTDLSKYRGLFKKVAILGAIIGIPCNIILAYMYTTDAYYTYAPAGIIEPLVYAYGVPALALCYAAGLALLYPKQRYARILNIFAPYGRMALTNYLMQSVIACLIFMSYGFGLYGSVGPLYFTLMGLGILCFQIPFSIWWLKKYQYGPMEWVWRSLTYRKWQPLKISFESTS